LPTPKAGYRAPGTDGFVSCTPYSSKMKPSRWGRPLARPNQC